MRAEKATLLILLLAGPMITAPVEAWNVPWGKVFKKGIEIILTGVVIGGADAVLDGNNDKQVVIYSPPPQPAPQPTTGRDDRDLALVFVLAGVVIVVIAAFGLLIKCICRKGKINDKANVKEEIEMV